MWDLAERVIHAAGSRSGVVLRPMNGVDIGIRVPTIEKAERVLGYRPEVDLAEGLARTIAWYREAVVA